MFEESERLKFRRYSDLNTSCIFDLRTPKGKLMDIFRNKKSEQLEKDIERMQESFRYVIKELKEELEALYLLISKEYVFIHPDYNNYISGYTEGELFSPKEARKYYSNLGYSYCKAFSTLGELWLKEKTNV